MEHSAFQTSDLYCFSLVTMKETCEHFKDEQMYFSLTFCGLQSASSDTKNAISSYHGLNLLHVQLQPFFPCNLWGFIQNQINILLLCPGICCHQLYFLSRCNVHGLFVLSLSQAQCNMNQNRNICNVHISRHTANIETRTLQWETGKQYMPSVKLKQILLFTMS